MIFKRLLLIPVILQFSACAVDEHGTIADLRDVDIEIVDTRIDDGLEKAMKSYQKFLEQTPESAMTPAAIRRLADLNIEREYGVINEEKTKKPITKKEIKKPTKTFVSSTSKDFD